MDKTNFLEETLNMLEFYKKSSADVRWVGTAVFSMSWEEFKSIANFEYNNGFGNTSIIQDLKIVGEDWWLERAEYDGSEWWEFKKLPSRPSSLKLLSTSLIRTGDRSEDL